jgi:hypothetical protein
MGHQGFCRSTDVEQAADSDSHDFGNFDRTMGDTSLLEVQQTHAEVFDVRPPDSADDDDTARRWTMYRQYEYGLARSVAGGTRARSGRARSTREIMTFGRLSSGLEAAGTISGASN